MERKKTRDFKNLNFNLKNEIFSFLQPKEIINYIFCVCKEFIFAVRNIKWFQILKENLRDLLLKASYEFSEMKELIELLINKGIAEKDIEYICLYLTLRKKKNHIILQLSKNTLFWCSQKNKSHFKNYLSNSNSIRELYIERNQFGYQTDLKFLEEALSINKSIHSLYLGSNDLLGEKILFLQKPLLFNKTIKSLYLDNNHLGHSEKSMLYLCEALKINDSIEILDLKNNGLHFKKNMEHIKEILKYNNSIKELYLEGNEIGNNETHLLYLKEGLENNSSLQLLNLHFNYIGLSEKNLQYLNEALQINNSIRILYLSLNMLENLENSMIYLKDAFKMNKTIITLDLRYNSLGLNPGNMIEIKEGLQNNNTIQRIDLRYNKLEKNIENFQYLREVQINNKLIDILGLEN